MATVMVIAAVPIMLFGLGALLFLGLGAAVLVFGVRGFLLARDVRRGEAWACLAALGYFAFFGVSGASFMVIGWSVGNSAVVVTGLVFAVAGAAGFVALASRSVWTHLPADLRPARLTAVSRMGATFGLAVLLATAGSIPSVPCMPAGFGLRIGLILTGCLLLLFTAPGVRRDGMLARIGFSVGLAIAAAGGILRIGDGDDSALPQSVLIILFAVIGLAALWIKPAALDRSGLRETHS